jgi:FkbM family methyltransferase
VITFDWLNKPYYLFRPTQVFRRILHEVMPRRPAGAVATATLPWGLEIRFDPREATGSALARTGVYDLSVCEAIYRLLDRGEVAVDVGANIGVMTSAMAQRAGPAGTVIAFEPHPEIFGELRANVGRWASRRSIAPIKLHGIALSDRSGVGQLFVGADFARNRGTASLVPDASAARAYDVSLRRLDDFLPEGTTVGVLKLDVEGHEANALAGGARLLARKRIRDIVFEDRASPPTPAMALLESHGYALFRLEQRLLGLRLAQPTSPPRSRSWDPPSYLATADPGRAAARLRKRGWTVLRGSRSGRTQRRRGAFARRDAPA